MTAYRERRPGLAGGAPGVGTPARRREGTAHAEPDREARRPTVRRPGRPVAGGVRRRRRRKPSSRLQTGTNVLPPASPPWEAPIVEAPVVGAPVVGAPIVGAPIVGAPHRGSPHRGSPHRGSPHRGSPHRGSPHRGSPHRGAPSWEPPKWEPPSWELSPPSHQVSRAGMKWVHPERARVRTAS